MQPIEIFFWPTPNGIKITIACEEMGLPYKITPVNIGKGDQFKPDFLKISPNTRMPAITDPEGPDGKPISVFESGAILQYLGRSKYKGGDLYGPTERDRVAIDQWILWQNANLGPNSGQLNHFRNYAKNLGAENEAATYAINRFKNEVNKLHGVMEGALSQRKWLANDNFTLADICSWGWMRARAADEAWSKEFPRTADWIKRIGEREGVQRALEAGKVVRQTPPEQMTPEEQAERQKMLYGQTAKSIAEAAAKMS